MRPRTTHRAEFFSNWIASILCLRLCFPPLSLSLLVVWIHSIGKMETLSQESSVAVGNYSLDRLRLRVSKVRRLITIARFKGDGKIILRLSLAND